MKGVLFSMKGVQMGFLFSNKYCEKSEGFNLWAKHPHTKR